MHHPDGCPCSSAGASRHFVPQVRICALVREFEQALEGVRIHVTADSFISSLTVRPPGSRVRTALRRGFFAVLGHFRNENVGQTSFVLTIDFTELIRYYCGYENERR